MTRKFKRRSVRCAGCGQKVRDAQDHIDTEKREWVCIKIPIGDDSQ